MKLMTNVMGLAALSLAAGLAMTGCVDRNYDLDNLDKTVTVGGDLTLPGSDTQAYTLGQILNLNANSTIRAAYQGEFGLNAGDYVLEHKVDPTTSSIEVPSVNLTDIQGSEVRVNIPDIPCGIPGAGTIDAPLDVVATAQLATSNVDPTITALSQITCDVPIKIVLGYNSPDYNGDIVFKPGYRLTFDPSWTLAMGDAATGEILEFVNGSTHDLKFKKNVTVNKTSKLNLNLVLTKLDFTKLPQGQGFVPGTGGKPGSFKLAATIKLDGNVSVDLGALSSLPAGKKTNIEIVTDATVVRATLLSFTGRLNPKIDINATSFAINDIPDFLAADGNNLDVADPKFFIDVTNSSPLAVELSATIIAHQKGQQTVVKIGAPATEAIVLEGNGQTKLCLSPSGKPGLEGAKGIKVADLGKLLSTIPDRIEIADIKAQAVDRSYTLNLGHTYSFTSAYDVIVPLAFGPDMRLNYTTEDTGWNSDLGKYSFDEATISAEIVNTVPLDMLPGLTLLDRNGQPFTGAQVTVSGKVGAGSLDKPSTTKLLITVKGTDLSGLDGMKIVFTATGNPEFTGVSLNEKQSLRFTDIKLAIKGGVTINLN